jgi:hypothetical protein
VRSDTLTDYTQHYSARVVANTALTAAGTSDLTLDVALPSTAYGAYQIFGTAGGSANVYRRYKVTNTDIASRLANYFPYPFAYRNSDGTAATLTSTPVGTVFYSSAGVAPYQQSGIGISVDPSSGHVITSKPTALVFSADGKTPVPVNDLQVFLPVHVAGLAATWPADVSGVPQYAGTAYSALGIARTKYISAPDWRDQSNSANMLLMASEYLDRVKDVVYEGSISYFGLLSSALTIGHALNIAGNGFDTGWESIACPITAVDLEYRESGSGSMYGTTLSFSNRRAPFSGAALQRPAMTGQEFGGQGLGFDHGGIAGTMAQVGGARDMAAEHASSGPVPMDSGGGFTLPTADDFASLGITGQGNNLASSGGNKLEGINPANQIQAETTGEAADRKARQGD